VADGLGQRRELLVGLLPSTVGGRARCPARGSNRQRSVRSSSIHDALIRHSSSGASAHGLADTVGEANPRASRGLQDHGAQARSLHHRRRRARLAYHRSSAAARRLPDHGHPYISTLYGALMAFCSRRTALVPRGDGDGVRGHRVRWLRDRRGILSGFLASARSDSSPLLVVALGVGSTAPREFRSRRSCRRRLPRCSPTARSASGSRSARRRARLAS